MPCRFASSGTVATSRSASRAILALNAASNFLRDLVISVLHRLRQSRTLHTLTFGPISGVHFKEHLLKELEERIDRVAREVVEDFYDVVQEPAFTSHLAQAIRSEVQNHPINASGLKIEVTAADMHDRASTMEKDTGADLYVSVVRRDRPVPVSKGMLVQAKWEHTLRDPKLPGQIEQMTDRTNASYVFAYGESGVYCAKASTIHPGTRTLDMRPIGGLITDGLRCTAGDPHIGRDLSLSRAQGLRRKMRELQVPVGLAATLTRTRK